MACSSFYNNGHHAYRACSAAATPTTAPAAPTAAPVKPTTALPNGALLKVGLVTDTGSVHDQAFNQLAWVGVQKAAQELNSQAKFSESKQPADYEQNDGSIKIDLPSGK